MLWRKRKRQCDSECWGFLSWSRVIWGLGGYSRKKFLWDKVTVCGRTWDWMGDRLEVMGTEVNMERGMGRFRRQGRWYTQGWTYLVYATYHRDTLCVHLALVCFSPGRTARLHSPVSLVVKWDRVTSFVQWDTGKNDLGPFQAGPLKPPT